MPQKRRSRATISQMIGSEPSVLPSDTRRNSMRGEAQAGNRRHQPMFELLEDILLVVDRHNDRQERPVQFARCAASVRIGHDLHVKARRDAAKAHRVQFHRLAGLAARAIFGSRHGALPVASRPSPGGGPRAPQHGTQRSPGIEPARMQVEVPGNRSRSQNIGRHVGRQIGQKPVYAASFVQRHPGLAADAVDQRRKPAEQVQ